MIETVTTADFVKYLKKRAKSKKKWYEKMVTFESGAKRSGDTNKLRYHRFMSFGALKCYCEYLNRHRICKDGSVREPDNWKQGIPTENYIASLVTHTFDLVRKSEGELVIDPDNNQEATLIDLVCAVMFNAHGLLHELLKLEANRGK